MSTYIQHHGDSANTLSEMVHLRDLVIPSDFLGLYAYATMSGYASFRLRMGREFWSSTPTRWLFGLDYGRTQPRAVRSILQSENTTVRVADGAWVVNQEGFIPRQDFHAKLCLMLNSEVGRFGMVVGSGNFSANGLRKGIEAGAVIYADGEEEYKARLASTVDIANFLWSEATPAEEILDAYEERWRNSFLRGSGDHESNAEGAAEEGRLFWIEAGYVTKNRGPFKPGNQIDLPRGMSNYFGLNAPRNIPLNTRIGALTFETPSGELVMRNLRLGNNQMEKITLPTPEDHGYDIYDGKVLLFKRVEDRFLMSAVEAADFEAAFGDSLSDVRTMASGRRYGRIA